MSSPDSSPLSLVPWWTEELARLTSAGLCRRRREVEPLAGGKCRIGGREMWNFAANDYLGLAGDSRLAQSARRAMDDAGIGARASPLVTGRTCWHAALEQRLARFKQAESAVLFPTGYAANVGTISALAGPEDVIFCDRLNHASLIDGSRLSQARFRVYPHGDVLSLRNDLAKSQSFRRRLIVTDSLFSMDGDHAPLAELVRLAEEFDALLLVDEAHATGVFGEQGRGLLEECRIDSPRVISVGTLSKAVGLQGGFVTGDQAFADWLWNQARTQMFSTALALPLCAAAIAAIDLIESEPQRRSWLQSAASRVKQELQTQGWMVPEHVRGPILPVLIGEPEPAVALAGLLEAQGLLVAAIRPPTVPHGTSRLRISLSYAHGDEGIEALVRGFQQAVR